MAQKFFRMAVACLKATKDCKAKLAGAFENGEAEYGTE